MVDVHEMSKMQLFLMLIHIAVSMFISCQLVADDPVLSKKYLILCKSSDRGGCIINYSDFEQPWN